MRVTPRASRNEVAGFDAEGTLRVAVTSPPVDGEANAAVVEVVARRLGVPRGAVRVARGQTGRRKLLEVDGLDEATVRARLTGGGAT